MFLISNPTRHYYMNPIIDKIKKLLRLGKDQAASAAEAAAALAKAQELAAANGISLTEIPDDSEESSALSHVTTPSQAGLPHKLASRLIKRHFGVDTLFDSTGRKAVIHIVGTPLQAQLATYVYTYLVRALRQSWKRRNNRRLRDRESYLRGFAAAISNQLPEVFPQTGLVLSTEHYIQSNLLAPGERIVTLPNSKKSLADASFHHGFMAGADAGIRNAMAFNPTPELPLT